MEQEYTINLTQILGLDQTAELVLDAIINMCHKYLVDAVELGFSPDAAEEMALTLHSVAVTRVFVGTMATVG